MSTEHDQPKQAGEGFNSFDLDEATQFWDFPLEDTPTDSDNLRQSSPEFFEATELFDFSQQGLGQEDPLRSGSFQQPGQAPPSEAIPVPDFAAPDSASVGTTPIDPLLRYRESAPPAPAESQFEAPPERKLGIPRYWIKLTVVVVLIVLIAVLARVFVVETFVITSNSMSPKLESGDRILVNKLAYTFGDVGRGDLVVFDRAESDPTPSDEDLIKRVIALENETIRFIDGRVYIGEQLLVEPYLDEGLGTFQLPDSRLFEACVNQTRADECQVASGHVYVLGDNRNSSFDSRFFGPIDEDLIVGKATVRIWPLGDFSFL